MNGDTAWAMSGENVDTVQSLYETWNAEGVAGVAERFWSERIEWHDDPSIPDAAVHYGRSRVRKHIEDRVEVLGQFRIAPERILDLGNERVLIVYRVHGEGARSDAPWEQRMAQLLTLERGRVKIVEDHLDADRALNDWGSTE
jgi:ketosteroid isomerase-like protein